MADPRAALITEGPVASPRQHWSPSHGSDLGRLSSAERRHYNRALKEMYKIVKLGSKRFELSETDTVDTLHSTDADATGLWTSCFLSQPFFAT